MRKLIMLLTSILLFTLLMLNFSALTPAQLINGEVSITAEGADIAILSDNLNATKYTPTEGTQMKITSQKPMQFLYIKFAEVPNEYKINADGKELERGRKGFLHELIELEQGVTELTITLPSAAITELHIYSAGELPQEIQHWDEPLRKADMLVFPSHADDEVLYMGAAIATSINDGKDVQVAYIANHWGDVERPHELLDGLWALGITAYPIIGEVEDIPSRGMDEALSVYPSDAILSYQVEQIRRFKPDVILGHDLDGEYGHGLHMLNATLLQTAFSESSDAAKFPESYEKYGVWEPQKLYLHLYKENQLSLNVDAPLEHFGEKTAYEVAKISFEKHKSQHKWDLAVEKSGVANCQLWGLAGTTVGLDSGSLDLFENVVDKPQPTSTPTPKEPAPASSRAEHGESKPLSATILPLSAKIAITAVIVLSTFAILYRKYRR